MEVPLARALDENFQKFQNFDGGGDGSFAVGTRGREAMEALIEQRSIAIAILYLKEALKENRRAKLSDAGLADLLAPLLIGETVNDTRINDLWNFKAWLSSVSRRRLIGALRALAKERGVLEGLEPARWAETQAKFAPELPEAFRDLARSQDEVGIALGDTANVLRGAWRLFYVSPVDREGLGQSEVRGNVCVFHAATPSDVSINVEIFSGHTRWTGVAFGNETHLYMRVSAENQTETSFFVLNRPTRTKPLFLGLGLALQRSAVAQFDDLRPAMALVCLGERVETPVLDGEGEGEGEGAAEGGDAVTSEVALRRLLEFQRPLSTEVAARIRDDFSVRYNDLAALVEARPLLAPYINTVKLNEKPLSMTWLHLAWR